MGYCGPFTSQTGYCERLKTYIATNLQWVQEQIQKHPSSPYWYQVLMGIYRKDNISDMATKMI